MFPGPLAHARRIADELEDAVGRRCDVSCGFNGDHEKRYALSARRPDDDRLTGLCWARAFFL